MAQVDFKNTNHLNTSHVLEAEYYYRKKELSLETQLIWQKLNQYSKQPTCFYNTTSTNLSEGKLLNKYLKYIKVYYCYIHSCTTKL